MPYRNDDIDELFRRAAEDYPLNTRGADWEKVQAALATEEDPQQIKEKHQLRWLLLLLPVLLIGGPLMDGRNKTVALDREIVPFTDAYTPTTKAVTITKDKLSIPVQSTGKQLGTKPPVQVKVQSANSEINPVEAVDHVQEKLAEEKTERQKFANASKRPLPSTQIKQNLRTEEASTLSTALRYFEKENSRIRVPEPVMVNNSSRKPFFTASSLPDAVETKKYPAVKRQRFYVGVMAGPDVSTVHFKQFSSIGFQAGVLLGYRLTNRFSIEAAALSSKKFYHSEGKHVRSSRVYRPAYMELLSADGNCRMIEIPVLLQYTFSKKETHTWFVAAGVSQYLMKKEEYTYDYKYANNGSIVSYNKIYENETGNWLSILQFSAGYTLKLGAGSSLRVAPYYALPITGIGYGEVPLQSMGLRLGITTKRF